MTIRVEIIATTTEEYREALWVLSTGLLEAPTADIEEDDPRTGGFPIGESPTTMTQATAAAEAAPQPAPPAAPTRQRRARTPLPETASPAISTGEERVDPQDAADEAAESAAAKTASGGALTLNDVRRLSKAYGDKYGVEAVVKDMRDILGCGISEIPDTQEAIAAAMAKIQAAINVRPVRPSAPAAPETPTPQPEKKPEPAAEGGLFGDPPQPEPEERSTTQAFQGACFEYAKKYDPKASIEPLKSAIMQDDIKTLLGPVFGLNKPDWPMIKALPGEEALKLGKMVRVVKQAIKDNPFKRGAVA
jgi:hypothetical protein